MTSHRIRRYALLLCVVILIPPLLWLGSCLDCADRLGQETSRRGPRSKQRALRFASKACRCACSAGFD